MKRIFVFLFTGLLLLTSCSKFEDGPSFSLRSKKQRFANSWKIEKVFEINNGVKADSTDNFRVIYPAISLDMGTEGNYLAAATYRFYSGNMWNNVAMTAEGQWTYTKGTSHLSFSGGVPGVPGDNTILRLKENELWLTGTRDDGTEMEVHWIPW